MLSALEAKRHSNDPKYAEREAERIAFAQEEKHKKDYLNAIEDNAEYERNPRAFMRRLIKSQEPKS